MFEQKKIRDKINEINTKLNDQEIWTNHLLCNQLLKNKNELTNFIEKFDDLAIRFNDTVEIINISDDSDDQLLSQAEIDLNNVLGEINTLYVQTLMNGKADSKNAFVEIHSGAGGTESQDWVEMLFRMYLKWSDSKGYKLESVDQSIGDEAGLKSITIRIVGEKSYGWLKNETGVHRLVRISPFDSQSRRHTSFASVNCYPEIDSTINIEILDKDLRIDTFRASGAGGQHVNKTDSAIRITHLPTKINVQCQSNRSQHRNKAIAMEMLKSKLYDIELKKEEEKNSKDRGEKSQIAWGHQIRSYIMQPYQLVKDHRTGYEDSNVNSILDGKIDRFLENQLVKL